MQPTKQVANVAPIIDKSKTKVDVKPKKAKQPRKQRANNSANENFNNKTVRSIQKLDLSNKPNMNPVQIVQPTNVTAMENATMMKSSGSVSATTATIATTTTTAATAVTTTTTTTAAVTTTATSIQPFQTQSNGTKLIGITAPMQQLSQQQQQHKNINASQCNSTNNSTLSSPLSSNTNISTINNNISINSQPSSSTTNNGGGNVSISHNSPAINMIPGCNNNPISISGNIYNRSQTHPTVKYTNSPTMPPLISVSAVSQAVPRVQTIQLTPQQQQLLQNVQMQIQQLSSKLQNKSLLATLNIPSDFDPNNPIYNKPLPHLNKIQNMTDAEIHAALQRLFIEQQKILAAGKVIPTISAPSHGIIPASSIIQNQQQLSSTSTSLSSSFQSNTSATISIQHNQQQQLQQQSNNTMAAMTNNQSSTSISNKISVPPTSASMSYVVTNKDNIGPNKNENQTTIPANVVQPNNHNSSTSSSLSTGISVLNTPTTTHRVHVYPMQHHNETTNKQSPVISSTSSSSSVQSSVHMSNHNQNQAMVTMTTTVQNQVKSKTEFQSSQQQQQILQTNNNSNNFIQSSSSKIIENSQIRQNQQQNNSNSTTQSVKEELHSVPVNNIKVEKAVVKHEIQEKKFSENSGSLPTSSSDSITTTKTMATTTATVNVPRHFL